MTTLNATAKATLKAADVTQAEWARANYMESGKWSGDVCGCPDSGRCANGFHHMGEDDCGCLPTLLAEYLNPEGWHTFPVTRAEELARRRGGKEQDDGSHDH
jgi:hypothetical protein